MNKSKKPLAMLSTAAVAGLIAAAITTPVSAKATIIDVTGKDGKLYDYNLDALKTSAVTYAISGPTDKGAALYANFLATKASVTGFYDDVKKAYVDYSVVQDAAVQAAINKQTFVLDTFTSATTTTTSTKISGANVVTADANGNVTVTPGTTSALSVSSVSAINTNKKSVALDGATNVQANATFSIVVDKAIDSTTAVAGNVKLYSVATDGTTTQVGLSSIGLDTNDTTNKTLVATPSARLTKGGSYKLVLGTGLKSTDGSTLAANKEVKFTVDHTSVWATANPLWIDGSAVTNVAAAAFTKDANLVAGQIEIGDFITLTFDDNLDSSTVTASNVRIKDLTADAYINYTLTTPGATQIKLAFTSALTAGHKYQIELNNLKTQAGYDVASDVVPFTAADTVLSLGAGSVTDKDGNSLDTNKLNPVLAGGMVLANQTTVYRQGTQLVVAFTGTPDGTTLTGDTVYITKKDSTVKVPATIAWSKDEGKLRVTPNANLDEGTDYVLHVAKGVKTAAGIATTTEITKSFSTYDLTAPTVLSVDGIDNVVAGQTNTITVHFSEKITVNDTGNTNTARTANANTYLTGAAIGVSNALELYDITGATNATADIQSVATSTDGKDLIIKVKPAANKINNAYRLTIGGKSATNAYITDAVNTAIGTASSANNALASNYVTSYTTANDTVKPLVTGVTKGTVLGDAVTSGIKNVANTQTFVFKMNKALATTFAGANTLVSIPADNATLVNETTGDKITLNTNTTLKGITQTGFSYSEIRLGLSATDFTADGKYLLTLTGLKDSNNNVMDGSYTFEFTVDQTATAVLDTTPATDSHIWTADTNNDGVLDTTDGLGVVGNSTTVLANSPIYIKFNEAVNGLSNDSISLVKDSDGTAVAGTITVDDDKKGFTFKPSAKLANGTAYKLTVKASAVTDNSGNVPASDFVKRFKTVDAATVPTVSYSVSTYNAVDNNVVATDSPITLTFNGKVNAATAALPGTYILSDTTAPGTIDVNPVVSTDGTSVTLYPDSALTAGHNYTIAVAGSLQVNNVALNSNADAVLTQAFKADSTVATLGIKSAVFNSNNKTLTITLDRVADTSAGLTANYTVAGGSLAIVGASGVVNGNTVTFVVDTTTSVIVPGTTTIATKASALYVTSTPGTAAFGTDAVIVK